MQQNTKKKNAALSELLTKEKEDAMQQPNSQITDNPLETQWEGVFIPYENYPLMALTLAQNLQAIKDALESGPSGTIPALHSIEDAIETLFPFSEFYHAGFDLFLLAVLGRLTPAFDLMKFTEQARADAGL